MKSALEVCDLKLTHCADWQKIVRAFNAFPSPEIEIDDFGGCGEKAWIFRGHGSIDCLLTPSVERAAEKKSASWVLLESLMLEEFRAKAPMHVDARSLPPANDTLAWLALMQHYGVPTRLLDFTYSPYVALYFAIRNFVNWRPTETDKAIVYVIGINARALVEVAKNRSREASEREDEYENRKNKEGPTARQPISLNPDFFSTDSDDWQFERQSQQKTLSNALSPHPIRRAYFNDQGFVSIAETTMHNPRLSSQQGVFLFNGAGSHSLRASLFTMMSKCKGEWYKCFAVPANILPSIERKLFQMNIHELSLFPDIEGLAGFLRQRSRLHWDPDDPSDSDQS
jgi:hypothetical protein